jgi:N6-adenosine-specific RNA methylase IME4
MECSVVAEADGALVRYDAACRALAEAKAIDEVRDIRDKAAALQFYARQAKNKNLEADAVEIRMRATRRLDQLRQAQKETIGLNTGAMGIGVRGNENPAPTLASQGIDKNLAKQARILGALSDEQFEASVARTREAVQRTVKIEADRTERIQKIIELSKGNAELSTEQRYPVVYCDPPWRYENPPIGATNRAIENHYPTMGLDSICALPVAQLATDDAVLFLWATAPKLAECLKVLEAWGFVYRTNLVWVKDRIGLGYHVRNQHELLLIAKRGDIPPPEPFNRPASVLTAPRREHSRKPDEAYALIERMYPELPKIELFARHSRGGWSSWGNES